MFEGSHKKLNWTELNRTQWEVWTNNQYLCPSGTNVKYSHSEMQSHRQDGCLIYLHRNGLSPSKFT